MINKITLEDGIVIVNVNDKILTVDASVATKDYIKTLAKDLELKNNIPSMSNEDLNKLKELEGKEYNEGTGLFESK